MVEATIRELESRLSNMDRASRISVFKPNGSDLRLLISATEESKIGNLPEALQDITNIYQQKLNSGSSSNHII